MLWNYKSTNLYTASHYRAEIDGLRAIAVVTVVANHLNKEWFPAGYLGVDVFFVISGYVITSSLLLKPHRNFYSMLEGFYARRFKRLLPALLSCLLLTSLFLSFFISPGAHERKSFLNTAIYALFGASNMFLYGNSVNYFGSSAELNPFTHTWSLGVEEQFYLLYPFIIWFSIKFHFRSMIRNLFFVLMLLSTLSLLCFAWLSAYHQEAAYYLMPPRFWELAVGCIAFLLQHKVSLRWKRYSAPLSLLALLGLLVTCFVSSRSATFSTLTAVVCTTMLILFLRSGGASFKALTLRPVVFVGMISYSLYLWHWPVIALSRWTIGLSAWTLPIQLFAISALSVISFFLIESSLRHRVWFGSSRKTILTGFAIIACAFVATVLLRDNLRKHLYLGQPAQMAEKGVGSLSSDRLSHGKVIWKPASCVLSSNSDVGKEISAQSCTVPDSSGNGRRLLVIGNSFSAAEFDMFIGAPGSGLGSVTITSSWDASQVPEVARRSPYSEANRYYWNSVIPRLISELRKGDILVMANDIAEFSPQTITEEHAERLDALKMGLSRIAQDMESRGIAVIFQTGIPFMREAGCSPDMAVLQWFQLKGPSCKYFTREYTEKRRSALQAMLQDVQVKLRNFYVLDLLDVFCPAEVCSFNGQNGEFLYRDEWSHPSVEANNLARPLFLSVVQRAVAETSRRC